MIAKRPSIPAGYSFAALPAVSRALHVEGDVELYELAPSDQFRGVLLLVKSIESDRVGVWLGGQDPRILTVIRPLTTSECPAGWRGFALSLRGRSLAATDEGASPARSEQLLQGLIQLVERTRGLGMFPRLAPAFTWDLQVDGVVCALLPRDGAPLPEGEQVREVARGLYRFVSGIDPADVGGSPPPLAQWSKFASQELSRVIERCLSPASPREALTTFAALSKTVGRSTTASEAGGPGIGGTTTASAASAFGRGLTKVAGMRALKELLEREVVAPLRDPEPYKRYGLSIPNGILLYGPPGCGKTYIARQLAEELGHYFVEVVPSELAGIYVHQSVIKIRELFDAAADSAPAIIFIDEFEAMVPAREQLGGHQQYKSEEVNEFLAQLNGCAERNIFIIAATNRPEKIDGAVRRTGRLDKLIYVGPPDREARRDMLSLHLEGRPVAADVDLDAHARLLEGYSASDLRFLVDEAARDALRQRRDIDSACLRSAMARAQASVTPEVAARYQSIEQRGS
jgi:hypothetical protein